MSLSALTGFVVSFRPVHETFIRESFVGLLKLCIKDLRGDAVKYADRKHFRASRANETDVLITHLKAFYLHSLFKYISGYVCVCTVSDMECVSP